MFSHKHFCLTVKQKGKEKEKKSSSNNHFITVARNSIFFHLSVCHISKNIQTALKCVHWQWLCLLFILNNFQLFFPFLSQSWQAGLGRCVVWEQHLPLALGLSLAQVSHWVFALLTVECICSLTEIIEVKKLALIHALYLLLPHYVKFNNKWNYSQIISYYRMCVLWTEMNEQQSCFASVFLYIKFFPLHCNAEMMPRKSFLVDICKFNWLN